MLIPVLFTLSDEYLLESGDLVREPGSTYKVEDHVTYHDGILTPTDKSSPPQVQRESKTCKNEWIKKHKKHYLSLHVSRTVYVLNY